ncbi:hypothetical protein M8818_006404 [Zalaria obscura]|uniref:Uncharacterized protein n=1 Tax=Zalaria obscura TaxID=2024903 RepID=A0ACC3S6Q0_9PEZI
MARNHLATNCATSPPTTTTYTTVDPFGTGHGGDGVVSKPAAAYCLPPANNDILGYEQHDLAQHNYKPSSASSAAGSSYTTDDAIDLEKGYARREDRARHPRGSRRREPVKHELHARRGTGGRGGKGAEGSALHVLPNHPSVGASLRLDTPVTPLRPPPSTIPSDRNTSRSPRANPQLDRTTPELPTALYLLSPRSHGLLHASTPSRPLPVSSPEYGCRLRGMGCGVVLDLGRDRRGSTGERCEERWARDGAWLAEVVGRMAEEGC